MPKHRGFTLIELLVVVAIIVLLIAILLPSLGRAREQAKTVQCASSMRQIGQLSTLFAGEHDGRGPGGGEGRLTNTTSLAWNDVLNAEVLQRDKYGAGARFGAAGTSAKTSLYCPNFNPGSSTDYSRPMCYNADASGNGTTAFYIADPSSMNSFYPDATPVTSYYLGTKLDRFRSDQFLLIESYAGDDRTDGVEADNNMGQLNSPLKGAPAYTNSTYGPFGGSYGPAFRHPYFKAANFLFFDNHIQTLKPKDDVGDHPGSFSGWTLIGPSHWRLAQ